MTSISQCLPSSVVGEGGVGKKRMDLEGKEIVGGGKEKIEGISRRGKGKDRKEIVGEGKGRKG